MRILQPPSRKLSQLTIDQDLDLGDYKLLTTNLMIREVDANSFVVRNRSDTMDKQWLASSLIYSSSVQAFSNGLAIRAKGYDANYVTLEAKDTGVALAEVARLVGAPTAYINLVKGRSRHDGVDLEAKMLIWGLLG